MRLSDFLSYEKIYIQCHDIPDADALASGYGVYYYLKKMGKSPKFVYSGRAEVTKSNLVLMIKELDIPVTYLSVEEAGRLSEDDIDLLVTVDCQYGEGNVTPVKARQVAMIDHHQICVNQNDMTCIFPGLGACATLVYRLLMQENIELNENDNLATALYYGLLTDTNNFAELCHPLDRNLQDDARFDNSLIRIFKNANISLEEVEIAGDALMHFKYNEEYRYAIVETKPCDPNVLGIISDMILGVDVVKACLIYSLQEFGSKISVRSCDKETKANELAIFLTEGVGNGGGHLDKAGGFIRLVGEAAREHLAQRMEVYYADCEIIYSDEYQVDLSGFEKHYKAEFDLGYVKACELAEIGSQIIVRTLEGDVNVLVSADTYIMIGIDGEIYPIDEKKFKNSYVTLDKEYVFDGEYEPEVIGTKSGIRVGILKNAKSCRSVGKTLVYAKQIDHRVKIFTVWDKERYYLGKPGDYLAVREDDLHDVYVIAKDIFERTYKRA